jgi:hypothetical protein
MLSRLLVVQLGVKARHPLYRVFLRAIACLPVNTIHVSKFYLMRILSLQHWQSLLVILLSTFVAS